jgi:PAS domain S-box-containing protein
VKIINHRCVRYGIAVISVSLGYLLRTILTHWVGPGLPLFITFYPAVMLTALVGGVWPGIIASLITVLVVDYKYIPPIGIFNAESPVEVISLVLFMSMGVFMSIIGGLYKRMPDHLRTLVNERTRELQESEEKFRFLVENVQDYAIFMLDPQGHVTTWNSGAERLKGYSAGEIIGKHFSSFYPPEDNKEARHELTIAAKNGHCIDEGWRVRKDGSRFWASVTITALRDKNGEILGYTKLVRDITDRKQLEEQLEKRARELASSNKELEAFSYSISHDLRTPLMAMKGFSNILLENYLEKMDTDAQDYLRRIVNSADKMSELIDDILSLSKVSLDEMKIQGISLSKIASAVVNTMRQAKPANNIEVTIAENIETRGDTRLMSIAISNLIGNAWKYSSKTPDAKIEFGEIKKDGKKVYYIRDNGAGFDMKFAAKIFEPFKRLHSDREFPGTGIGLAIVKRVIEKHGGKIWVESEPGKGAAFYFTLCIDRDDD